MVTLDNIQMNLNRNTKIVSNRISMHVLSQLYYWCKRAVSMTILQLWEEGHAYVLTNGTEESIRLSDVK